MNTKSEVISGDCLDALKRLERESVDLIYLDPPFFTQRTHQLSTRDGATSYSFNDLWQSHSEYVSFLMERVKAMHRVLKNTGTLFLHCNSQCSHLTRFVLDEVFGEKMFRSEIIWSYKRWSNSQKGLLPAHQTIFFYSKSSDFTFNEITTDYSASTNIEQILQKRKRDHRGKAVYAKSDDGSIVPDGPKKGVPLGDVWEIPYLNPKAKERVGYPTQKPVLLLERILSLCSNEGDVVLDPFCGSGTTLVAAQLLCRNSIGIDVSEEAVELTKSRLANPVTTRSALLERGRGEYLREDMDLLELLQGLPLHPVQRNKGADAILKDHFKGRVVLLRIQRDEETLLQAASALRKAAVDKGAPLLVIVATQDYKESQQPPMKGVIVVPSTALILRHTLEQYRELSASDYAEEHPLFQQIA